MRIIAIERPLSVLVVEDSPDAAEEMLLTLRRGGLNPTWARVETADGLRAALAAGPWDAVLSAYRLSRFAADAALEVVRSSDPDLPFIVVSGAIGENAAVALMRAAANDCIFKQNLVRLAPTVEREVREAGNRRAKRAAERAAVHLAAVVESSDDAIISNTLDGILTSWNAAAERLYGWTGAEAIGRNVSILIPPDRADEQAENTDRLRAGVRIERLETIRIHRDGPRIDVSLTISPVRDAAGRVVGASKIAHDISEKKRAQESLRRSEERYRGLLESIPALVWVCDAAGRPVLHNRRWYEYTGQTPEDNTDDRWREALHPEDAAEAIAVWDRSRASGEPYATEYRIRRTDGAYLWFSSQGTALTGPGGIEQWVGICTDIDGRKRTEVNLRRTADLLTAVSVGTPDVVFVKDQEGRYLLLNPTAVQLVGRPIEELLGQDDSVLFGPSEARRVMANDRRLMEAGLTETLEEDLTAAGGTRTFLSSKGPYRDPAGNVIGLIGTSRDITDPKRAECVLRASEERFRAFMEHSPAAAFIKEEGGRYLYVNSTWRRQFDPEPIDWLGKTDHDFWRPETADLFRASDMECLTRNAAVQTEEYARSPAGEEFTWLVMKFPLVDGGCRRVGGMAWNITDLKRVKETVRVRDRAIQAVTQGILITDPSQQDNPIVYASPGFVRLTGHAAEAVIGHNCRFLQGKDTDPAAIARVREAIRDGESCSVELMNYRKDGSSFWNHLSISPVRDAAGRLTHFVGVQTDVTARRSLEEQFRQAQKMEAVGQLAGGVAHDFNNLLTIINGYSDLLLRGLPRADPSRELVAEIIKAGERSAGLTRQLLAFSRQQILAPRVFDLNAVVTDTEKMLRYVVGEDIRLTTTLAPDLWAVRADPGQVEQVLMNLTVNARDAMPAGGRLTIETRNVEVDETYARTHADARTGPHVLLSVTDTGSGIPRDVMARIFEPFFTTKGVGKGTGLGLATVYGIVKQSGGHIAVSSEVGVGTAFKAYLPRSEPEAGSSTIRPVYQSLPRGTETVLVVEDESALGALTCHVLAECGYTVIGAGNGDEAVQLAASYEGPIHLLVTDVVMPGLGGRAVAERVTVLHPGVRVLFVSGHTDDAVIRHGVLCEGVHFLQKPFSPIALALKVRAVMDATREAPVTSEPALTALSSP